MKVMAGSSQELPDKSWAKVEVTLDDTDLLHLCVEADVEPGSLTHRQRYWVLYYEAQYLCLADLLMKLRDRQLDTVGVSQQMRVLLDLRDRMLKRA